MHPMLNIAVNAARSAGSVIARKIDRLDTINVSSKALNDFVTDVDREAERRIIDTILRAYPDHAILAEESGRHSGNEYEWIIDPLDGTTNFIHGFPQVAVSIALRHKGRMEHGVIFDPLSQELFTATRGGGARLEDRRIRVSNRTSLKGALLGTGFPFRSLSGLHTYLDTLGALIPLTAGVRRAGSAALDLAYVAAGRLDGFWEFGLSEWDLAAGTLLIQEAGGIVCEPDGADAYLTTGDVVTANPKILRAMLRAIRPALEERRVS